MQAQRTAPVVHEHDAKDVLVGLAHRDGLSKSVASANDKGLEEGMRPWDIWRATISSSKSSFRVGPKTGPPSGGLSWPHGRTMGVPETTTEDDLPWYPTGRWR